MGGYGSTRWEGYTKADTVDMYPRAIPDNAFTRRYARTVTAAQIRPDVDPPGTRPWYPEGDTWIETGFYTPGEWHHFDLEWQPRYKGGYELYIICPACRHRCKTLYIRGAMACRKCHKLSYTSCQSAIRPERRSGYLAALDAVYVLEKLRDKAQRTLRQLSRCEYGSIRWRKLNARMERYGRRLEHLHRLAELFSRPEPRITLNGMPLIAASELSEFSEPDLTDLLRSIDARELSEMDSPDFNVDVEADGSPDFSFDTDALLQSIANQPLPDLTDDIDISQFLDQVFNDLEISAEDKTQ